MYIPSHFAMLDEVKLFDFIEKHSFAIFVSQHGDEPFATHLPVLLRRDQGPHGTLIGHMAKANPHWQFADGKPALVVFAGPHAYVSPSWYEAENVVPTWNYVAVHAYGTFQAIHDPQALTEILRDTVSTFEDPESSWKFEPGSEFTSKLQRQIVGFRIEIARIEGKWKLNQNHPRERREKVIAALRKRGDRDSLAIADLMQDDISGR